MEEQGAPTIAEDLPTLERESVEDWLRRPRGLLSLARLLLPESVTIEHAQVGSLVLRPSSLEPEAGALASLAACCEAFSLDAVDGGVLLIEHSFARHLSNAMVGLSGSAADRPLSRIERGIVAGFAAVSLAKLSLPLGVTVVGSLPISTEDALCIHVRANLQNTDGHAWLCATATSLRHAWHTFGIIEMLAPLNVELARTQLPNVEALSCRPGDLVVFDDSPAYPAAASFAVDICCRGKRLPLCLDRDGCVRLDDTTAATRRIRPPRKPLVQPDLVELTAELARKRASSPTADRNADTGGVLLRLGSSDWAEGLLAAHQDRLAVRITRILTKTRSG